MKKWITRVAFIALLTLSSQAALAQVIDFEDLQTRDNFYDMGIEDTYLGYQWAPSGTSTGWASATTFGRVSSESIVPVSGTAYGWNWSGPQSLLIDFKAPTSVASAYFANLGSSYSSNAISIQMLGYDADSNLLASSSILSLSDSFQKLTANFSNIYILEIRADQESAWFLVDDITLGGLSFSLSPNTPNQKIILEHLDGQLDSDSGEFVTDLTILAGLPDGEFQDALDALSPEPYIGLRDAGLRVVRSGSATVTERLQSLYLAQMAGVDLDQLYAASNSVMSDAPPAIVSSTKNGFSIWVKPYMFAADQNGDSSYFGYTHDYVGLSVGADYRFADHYLIGLLVGYADGSVDYDTVDAETDMASTYVGLYGAALINDFYLHAQATWFMHDFDTYRNLDFIGRTAKSSHDANEYGATLGCEYLGYQLDGWNMIPGLAVEYSYYDEEGFQENGAGSFNLEGDSVEYDSLASNLGVRINKKFDLNGGSFIPEFKASWVHEFADTDREITSCFAGSAGDAFTIDGVEPERDSFIVGVGANFVGDTMAVYMNYDNEFSSDYWGWGVSTGFKFSF
jgi:uncharacterized protein YhjY with autotransporter beta-barrel domain